MSSRILIADSGSTKAEWGLLSAMGNRKIVTQGISPYFMTTEDIRQLLEEELMPSVYDPASIGELYYYGTGCTAPAMNVIVGEALRSLFPVSRIYIDYDLAGAAHALCARKPGIACILGTGSNSCYYDGEKILHNSPGLGYILGDEGSGAHLGKKIVTAYLYGKLAPTLHQAFEEMFRVDRDSLLEKVYSASLPNRYLGSFSRFLAEHQEEPVIADLLRNGLNDFFDTHLLGYPDHQSVPVHFTGSIAWAYRDILTSICEHHGMMPGRIVREPMQELVTYHRESMKYL